MSIYDFLAKKSNGDIVSMQTYKNKVTLFVNTALHCTFTYQFEDLQRIYEKYDQQPFTILSFPSNQFAEQNPEDGATTASVCRTSYGVKFPTYESVDVNGEHTHPLFTYLKQAVPVKPLEHADFQEKMLHSKIKDVYPQFFIGNNIRWNFTKFLVDADGNVIKRFEPTDSILDVEQEIEKLLSAMN